MNISYQDWYSETFHQLGSRGQQRVGQFWFNRLRTVNQRLASMIVGSPADPFYDDKKLSTFYQFCEKNWNMK